MQLPPAYVLAAWPKPNYTNPETRGPVLVVVLSILLVVVTFVVGVRVYTRCCITHGFGFDDTLILLAFLPTTAFSIAGIVGSLHLQWNRHTWDVEPSLLALGLKMNLTLQILFDAATNLTKLSMLALLVRITRASGHRTARRAALGIAAVVTADATVFLIVDVSQCRPLAAYWTLSVGPQRCIDQASHLLSAGIFNTVMDAAIALFFPVPFRHAAVRAAADAATTATTATTTSLATTPTDRLGPVNGKFKAEAPTAYPGWRGLPPIVGGLLVGGLAVVAAGAARTFYTWAAATSSDGDVIWRNALVLLASALELNIAVVVASLPAMKPFFCRCLPAIFADVRLWFASVKGDWQARLGTMKRRASVPSVPLPWLKAMLPKPRGADKLPAKPPPDLNKPLPAVQSVDHEANVSRTERQVSPVTVRQSEALTLPSVYDFQTHEDGIISVHRVN
ncbi:integral membrane protein [Niveomyces insectorum RCEF 264]|uniref:Integral membrane protein n=1 Tax=Niveomyces insectorum RCEF 264 TaxID=1081102 RepID=A0A162IC69_9HYPO|nr:integral membrane protein [Niveomyces insectorum RCEF 264]